VTRRALVVIGTVVVFATTLALLGGSSTARFSFAPSSGESEAEGAKGEGPEAPAVYMARKESSGRQLTTAMFQRAMRQASAMPVSTGTWTDMGPTDIGGRITDLVVDTGHPDTIFIAAAGGGIWKSTDRGSTFTTSWPDDSVQAIGALARGSDGTMWAGTGEANPPGGGLTYFGDGVYSSTDNGATWQNRGLSDSGSFGKVVVDPTNPARIFAAAAGTVSTSVSQRGIFRSVDAGATWQLVLAPPNATTGGADIAIDPTNPNKIFASLWDHKRNNGARTYGGVGSGLFLSTDGGDTWTRSENIVGPVSTYDATGTGLHSAASLGRIGVAIAPSDPTRVYVVFGNLTGADKGFYVSNDGGASFTAGGRAGGNSGFEWWFGRLFVDPLNKDRLFNMDVNLRLSTNGGTTWATSGSVHADQHGMAWDPNVPNRVYLGNDGGIYRSDSNGSNGTWVHATYEPWNQGYHVAVAQDDPLRIAVGLQDNGSNRTWTNASTVVTQPLDFNSYGGGDGHYVAIDPTNHNFYYQCSQGGSCGGRADTATSSATLGFSSKHGVRWTTDAPLVIDPNNPLVVYVGGEVLDRSLNHGQGGFTQISPGGAADLPGPIPADEQDVGLYANLYGAITAIGLATDPAPGSVSPNNYAQTIYVGTDTGKVWKTSDAGGAWTQMTGLPTRWVNGIAVDPTDKNHAAIVFSGYREGDLAANIWETKDGGATWQNISGNLPNAPLDAVVIDKADNALIVSGDLGVFFLRQPPNLPPTTTWSRLGTNLPNTSVQDIKLQASSTRLYAMTFGRGVQTIALPGDAAAPITTAQLSPPPMNGWYMHPTVTLDATDGTGAGIYKTEYRLDGGAWQTYSAPFAVTGDGSHTLEFKSTDQAGNEEAPGSITFQIDATAPTTTASLAPPAVGGWYQAATVTLAGNDGTGSGVGAIEYQLDAGTWQPYTEPFAVTGDGTHTVSFHSVDQAGNVEDPKSTTFQIDATAPETTASLSPAAVNGWYVHPTVTLDATDAGSGVASSEYSLDGGVWTAYSAPFAVTGDGTHELQFRSTDSAGNVETANTRSFRIDATGPSIAITRPAGTYALNASVLASYACTDGGSDVASCTGTVANGSPIDTSPVGTHSFTVSSEDNAGNTSTKTISYDVIWAGWSGFLKPIDDDELNDRNAGSTVPVKFSLGGNFGLGILAAGYPKSVRINCTTGATIGTATSTDGGGLKFSDGQYHYNWETEKAWKGTCRMLIVKLDDNTVHKANFRFK
jgi:hypothetical protein